MIEVAYRQQKGNKHQSFNNNNNNNNRSPKSNSTSTIGSEIQSPSTIQQKSSSTFFGSGPEHSAPLQIKPLKAPSSPLASDAPSYSSLLASVDPKENNSNQLSPSMVTNNSSSIASNSIQQRSDNVTGNTSHVKRVRKGQKLEEIQPVIEDNLSLQQIDSPFQLQEYLALLVRQNPHDVERIVNLPQATVVSMESLSNGKGKGKESGNITTHDNDQHSSNGMETFMGGAEEEVHTVDTDVWVYEQLRRIVADFTTPWLISLQRACDRKRKPSTCDAMNADDWMYLCASHGEEKQCCAIDYIIHTLDGTTALLNSHRHFPSKTYIPTTSLRHFGSVSRRLSRIFVHAYEHHRDVFEACEAETSLYSRFLTLVQMFDLIAVDSLPQLGGGESLKNNQNKNSTDEGQDGEQEIESINANDAVANSNNDRGVLSANRKLFDHNEASEVPSDAIADEDDEIDAEPESSLPNDTTRIQRSDSNASRITAIHMDDVQKETE